MNFPNPLNAMQILWINIIMDGPPAQRYRGTMGVVVFGASPQKKNHFLLLSPRKLKNVSFEVAEGCK